MRILPAWLVETRRELGQLEVLRLVIAERLASQDFRSRRVGRAIPPTAIERRFHHI